MMLEETPETIRRKSCCLTGHRILPTDEGKLQEIYQNVKKVVRCLVMEDDITRFYAGGALGFDALASKAILELKKELPQIQLFLIFPYEGQENSWSWEDCYDYAQIKDQADCVKFLSKTYTEDCMKNRNFYMVDHSSVCIYYLVHAPRSGTAQTVRYAKMQGLRLIDLRSGTSLPQKMEQETLFGWKEAIYFTE